MKIAVTGSFDGANLVQESERVSLVSAGQNLMCQFRLVGSTAEDDDNQLVGEYRETIWGYGPQPLTIVGHFSLYWATPAATNFIFMPVLHQN